MSTIISNGLKPPAADPPMKYWKLLGFVFGAWRLLGVWLRLRAVILGLWRFLGRHFGFLGSGGFLEGLGASFLVPDASFSDFRRSWVVILGSWGLILRVLEALGVTLWSKTAPQSDFVGFWEPFRLYFVSF